MDHSAKISRIFEFDIIRVLAMFWVVTYHFGCEYSFGPFSPIVNFFCVTPNFDFGNVAVTMFLVLSGALLYRKYGNGNVGGLPAFYFKRAKAIYPPFWILNLYVLLAMVRHWISDGSPFFAGNPLKLLLTFSGVDGYLKLFDYESYYFCGEWFVAAIILLYLLFPFLAWAYKKNRVALLVVLGFSYGLQFVWPNSWLWDISVFPATLMLKFVLGFLLMDLLPRLRSPSVKWVSLVVFLGLSLVMLPVGIIKNDLLGSVAGIAVFLGVLNFGGRVKESSLVWKTVQKLAPLTYCVFLIQHIAIVWLQMAFVKALGRPAVEFSAPLCLAILAATLGVILVAAYVLKLVSDKVVKFAESKFLS
ncbi:MULTISPECIES: acyltransferase [unclassified Fibrobacter]|uniref:acyltransferase family protein n=1 Tax=unclassified Fibrobacter TaxID=2634177 RepID=UPI001304C687|nr:MULTISPECIES: acyltransferase [unclassified Fibrobacter]